MASPKEGIRPEPQIIYITLSDYEVFVSLKLHLGARWGEFLKVLDLYNNRIIGKTELGNISRELIGGNTKVYNDFRTKVISRLPAKRKLLEIEEDEMDVEGEADAGIEGDASNVSYRQLSEDERRGGEGSGRTALCDEVLNDNWIASQGDEASELRRTSSKKLNEYEDGRFELDMIAAQHRNLHAKLLEIQGLVAAHAKSAQQQQAGESITPFVFDASSFTPIHKQSLRSLYGDKAQSVEDHLCQHPVQVIPVILARLEQKQQEWKEMKQQQEEKWKKTMEDNYLRSLDYKIEEWREEDGKNLEPQFIQQNAAARYQERKQRQEEGTALFFWRGFAFPCTEVTWVFFLVLNFTLRVSHTGFLSWNSRVSRCFLFGFWVIWCVLILV